jgi:hypothetical protein
LIPAAMAVYMAIGFSISMNDIMDYVSINTEADFVYGAKECVLANLLS